MVGEDAQRLPGQLPGKRKLAILAMIVVAILLFFALGLNRYMSIAGLKAQHAELVALYHDRPALVISLFIVAQVGALALSLPGAVVFFALAAGALFGTLWGSAIVLAAVTMGDSLGFLIARFVLRDWVERRFDAQLERFQAGIDRHGGLYLLSLRLMALIPFFIVNLAMGVTRMRLRTFAPVSFVGLIPTTVLHVSAGTQLSRIRGVADIASPALIGTFILLGTIPLVFRFVFRRWRAEEAPLAD